MMYRKYYAFNNKGEKLFCKVFNVDSKVLYVDFYLPQSGFSIIYDRKGDFIRFTSIKEIADGRRFKSIVSYKVHPSYLMSFSFNTPKFKSVQEVINDIFEEYINIIK